MRKPVCFGVLLLATGIVFEHSRLFAQMGATTSVIPSTSPQSGSRNIGPSPFPGTRGSDPFTDMMNSRTAAQMEKLQNSDRQRRLHADTDKLIERVNDLKKELGGEQPLSPTDLGKRADEIEKLAKNVKDRMKG